MYCRIGVPTKHLVPIQLQINLHLCKEVFHKEKMEENRGLGWMFSIKEEKVSGRGDPDRRI